MGTAMQESHLTYLRQVGGGPAMGVFQMEPNTHDDLWDNFIDYQPQLRRVMRHTFGTLAHCTCDRMISDMLYAAVMARLQYYRRPEPLPDEDLGEISAYWKQWYNTPGGHGTRPQFNQNWIGNQLDRLWSGERSHRD